MERQPSFDKIIGGTAEQLAKVVSDTESKSQMSGETLYYKFLVEPTIEEKYAIQLAVDHANYTANHYGSSRIVDPERIFILKSKGVASLTENRLSEAMFNAGSQSAAVDRTQSVALVARSAFHEALHLASYQSAQLFEDNAYGSYRNGIGMVGRKEEAYYFADAQEAIIAVLSRRFFEHVVANDVHYEREIERTAFIKDWIRDYVRQSKIPEQHMLERMKYIDEVLIFPNNELIHSLLKKQIFDDDYKMGVIEGYYKTDFDSGSLMHERRKERELLDTILDRVVIAGKGKIKKNELFDEFARAHFTGNYLPLARTIEGILGKGSFREIAKELGSVESEK